MSLLNHLFRSIHHGMKHAMKEQKRVEAEEKKRYVNWHSLRPYFEDAWEQVKSIDDAISENTPLEELVSDWKKAQRSYAAFNSFGGPNRVLDDFPTSILYQMLDLKKIYEALDDLFSQDIHIQQSTVKTIDRSQGYMDDFKNALIQLEGFEKGSIVDSVTEFTNLRDAISVLEKSVNIYKDRYRGDVQKKYLLNERIGSVKRRARLIKIRLTFKDSGEENTYEILWNQLLECEKQLIGVR
jgi:hypothetical protein